MPTKPNCIPCNCPWMECPHHPGALCHGVAWSIDHCPNPDCDSIHYLGDGALGEGIHICKECAEAILTIFKEDVLNLMSKLTEFVPAWMKPLERICRVRFHEGLEGMGWITPQEDALGILAFAYLTTKEDKNHRIPPALLKDLVILTKKLKSMAKAYEMDDVHVAGH